MSMGSKRFLAAILTIVMAFGLFVPAGAAQAELAAAGGFLNAAGMKESAYATWEPASGVSSYTASVIDASGKETALDDALIRSYPGYMRVDALGLKAGKYKIKVTPNTGAAMTTEELTVTAYDRSGYAFENSHTPGAYNADGTLKANAKVVYITQDTASTVKLSVAVDKKGDKEVTGLPGILDAYKKKVETDPLCIRVIGTVANDYKGNLPGHTGAEITGTNQDGASTSLNNSDYKGDIAFKDCMAPVTIEGVGCDAVLCGIGLRFTRANDVEVRNLGFMNCNSDEADSIGFQPDCTYVWVHNNDIFYGMKAGDADQAKGDGALDTKGVKYATLSYNHFWDSGKANLCGLDDNMDYMTYHHNWYDHSDSRHPRVRYTAHCHVYNNYYDDNAKYGVGATTGSSIFVENNYFRNCKHPVLISMQGTDEKGGGTFSSEAGGMIKMFGNVIIGGEAVVSHTQSATDFDAYVATSKSETVPATYVTKKGGTTYNNFDTQSGFYTYKLDAADDVPTVVKAQAGRQGGSDFDYQIADGSDVYAGKHIQPIAELATKINNYKSTLVRVGGSVDGSSSGEHTHVTAWRVKVAPSCNKDTQALVPGVEEAYCTICQQATGQTREVPGQHTDANGDSTCDNCGADLGSGGGGGGTVIPSGNTKTLKHDQFIMTNVSADGKKSEFAANEVKDATEGYFDVVGGVLKRNGNGVDDKKGITLADIEGSKAEFFEMPKNDQSGITFTVTNVPAKVSVVWGSPKSDDTQQSILVIKKGDSVLSNETKGGKSNTTTVDLAEPGDYLVTSGAGTGSARVFSVAVTEPGGGSTQPSTTPSSSPSTTPSSQPSAAPVAVSGVKLNTNALTLRLSGTKTATLKADVVPANASNKNVTWSTSDATVATVAGGVVTALKAGTATITVTTKDGNKTATCAVTVKGAAGGATGESHVLTADEVVKAMNPSHQDGKDYTHGTKGAYDTADGFFTIYPKVNAQNTYDAIGIKAVSKWPAADKTTATWSDYTPKHAFNFAGGSSMTQSKDPTSGVISDKISNVVKFTVGAPATVKVWYTMKADGDAGGVGLYVADALEPVAKTMVDGKAGKGLFASVDTPAAGTYYVGGVTTETGDSAKIVPAKIEVALKSGSTEPEEKPVTGVSLDKATLALHTETAKTATLTATVAPADADVKDVTWTSSDEAVASVDQTGKVTALKAGMATITVTTADGGFTATCAVTVSAPGGSTTPSGAPSGSPSTTPSGSPSTTPSGTPSAAPSAQPSPVAVTGVKLNRSSATVKVDGTLTLTATVLPSKAANKAVTWASDDTYVVSVDTNGKITAHHEGKANVTVKTVDGGFTAKCAVTVSNTSGGGSIGGGGGGGSSSGGSSSGGSSSGGSSTGTGTGTSTGTGTATLPFIDVAPKAWFHDAVQRAFDKGLMKGTDDVHFAPNATTTRAMVATVLFRLDGEKKTDVKGLFADVADRQWYTQAVAWAADKGVVKGYDETTFAPDDNVTREQLAVMLYRYAAPTAKSDKDLSAFADAAAISPWATDAITWAVDKGIITGKSGGILDPQGLATRAEICTMLVRFLDLKK